MSSGKGSRPTRSLADEMSAGSTIESYTKHESGNNYTVHVKDSAGETRTYTNVTGDHLQEFLGEEPEEGEGGKGGGGGSKGNSGGGRRTSSSGGNGGGGGSKKSSGDSLFDSIMKNGGKVSDIKETKRGTYSVHVTDSSGKTHNFSSVGGDHLEGYGVSLPE